MYQCTDSLGEAELFLVLNWNSEFGGVKIKNEKQEERAFVRMPFWLQNAPRMFQVAMDVPLSAASW